MLWVSVCLSIIVIIRLLVRFTFAMRFSHINHIYSHFSMHYFDSWEFVNFVFSLLINNSSLQNVQLTFLVCFLVRTYFFRWKVLLMAVARGFMQPKCGLLLLLFGSDWKQIFVLCLLHDGCDLWDALEFQRAHKFIGFSIFASIFLHFMRIPLPMCSFIWVCVILFDNQFIHRNVNRSMWDFFPIRSACQNVLLPTSK